MNKNIMKQAGFSEEVKLVELYKCPICMAPLDKGDFRDALSVKEYEISGMCQSCQDSIFQEEVC